MKIPKSVAAFKTWARTTRKGSAVIQSIAACVAYNEAVKPRSKGDHLDGHLRAIIEIACEECAIRWDKAAKS